MEEIDVTMDQRARWYLFSSSGREILLDVVGMLPPDASHFSLPVYPGRTLIASITDR